MKISANEALAALKESRQLFLELLKKDSFSVEIYRPIDRDHQTPHDRDEIYIILQGSGNFEHSGKTQSFGPGDFFFVPAYEEHRFVDFSEDFSTWVIFVGPRLEKRFK
ncbi:MAG: cupin domain-containing protein [Saprospiraceae bacterium]|nr:cupin domain-containing protein [Saprospiraceae bacterium]